MAQLNHTPYHPCIVYSPTFTIKNQPNGKYTIHGWYRYCNLDSSLSFIWHWWFHTFVCSPRSSIFEVVFGCSDEWEWLPSTGFLKRQNALGVPETTECTVVFCDKGIYHHQITKMGEYDLEPFFPSASKHANPSCSNRPETVGRLQKYTDMRPPVGEKVGMTGPPKTCLQQNEKQLRGPP